MEPITPASDPQEPAPGQHDPAPPAESGPSPVPPADGPVSDPAPGLASDAGPAPDAPSSSTSGPADPTPEPGPADTVSSEPAPDLSPARPDPITPAEDPAPPAHEEPPVPITSQTLDQPENKKPLPPPYSGAPGSAIAPGGQPVPPSTGLPPAAQPTVMVGDGGIAAPPSVAGKTFVPTDPAVAQTSTGRKLPRLPKKVFIPALVILVLAGSAAAFYFGYYNSPSFIYAESLKNTGTGYDRLVTYADQQSQQGIKGYSGSGSYSVSDSGNTVDGNMTFKDSQGNSDTTFSLGTQGIRVTADARTIKSSAAEPDVYLKFSGIKGLGSLAGDPAMDAGLARLDGKWIFIDHTILEGEDKQSGQTNNTGPTREQLLDEAKAFGQVNKEYLFSTAKDKAVTTVVQKVGKETVDGHQTYHYKIALNKDNVKKYILAQRDALEHSKLDAWLKKSHEESAVIKSFNDSADSTKNIKSSDEYDIWMDTSRRVIYKVRYSYHPNPASNYVDYGLDYKGGNDYPFFISGKAQDGNSGTDTYSFVADVNTDTNTTTFKLDDQTTGTDPYKLNANFSLKTSKTVINIARPLPNGVVSLTQALDDLGLGSAAGGPDVGSGTLLNSKLLTPGTGLSIDSIRGALLRQALNR